MNTLESRPFGLKDKIAYMTGDIANDMSFMMSAFFSYAILYQCIRNSRVCCWVTLLNITCIRCFY